ncbi:MAG: prepilin-type N-terminal cleavage/methylation domain-containing protein [Sumerlaeia bacterium]
MQRSKAFTLIELLIVVAIIAILAAIAVPNFLEAQVRSKVSRVKSDIRSLATAIEAYAVDHNNVPPGSGEHPTNPPNTPGGNVVIDGVVLTGTLGPWITTPIAYFTKWDIQDPFIPAGAPADTRTFTYQTYTWRWAKVKNSAGVFSRPDTAAIGFNEGAALNGEWFKRFYGSYRLLSLGPDQSFSNNPAITAPGGVGPGNIGLPYDATNGTVSFGNILRSQSESEQKSFNGNYPALP